MRNEKLKMKEGDRTIRGREKNPRDCRKSDEP